MGQYSTMDRAIPGLIAEGIQNVSSIRSRVAKDDLAYGQTVWGYLGDENDAYEYKQDIAKIVFDSDFGGTDAVTFTVLKDGGSSQTTATVTYASSHANTMDLIIAALRALTGVTVYEALTAEDAANRTLYVRTKGYDITLSMADVADSPPAETITYQTDMVFLGIAVYTAKNADTAGVSKYYTNECIAIMERGHIWATSNGTMQTNAIAYADNSGANLGTIASSGDTINCIAKSDNITNATTSDALTMIEVQGTYKPNAVRTFA